VPLHLLSPREVQVARDGDHPDGGGLLLRVRGQRAVWVFRYTSPAGRRLDAGFGIAHRDSMSEAGESLRQARDRARRARDSLAAGIDFLDQKRSEREPVVKDRAAAKAQREAQHMTLARYARRYHETQIEPKFNPKYASVWIASLERHMPSEIWYKPIAEVGVVELYEALAAVKRELPETADRMRRRLAAVFDDAVFFGCCASNPADTIRRKLAAAAGAARGERNFAALPYAEVPAFVDELRRQPGIGAKALEFALLTAARTGEVIGAVWDEIDERTSIWRIPGERMKGRKDRPRPDHVVYLVDRARAILHEMRALGGGYMFPSPSDPCKPLSNMAMLTLLKRMKVDRRTTVHGLCRASFSTWANENAIARPDVIEAALAHREGDLVRAAYNRASFAAERAALLRAWADFIDGSSRQPVTRPDGTPITDAAVIQFPAQGPFGERRQGVLKSQARRGSRRRLSESNRTDVQ
jgi:integrase